jgi:hypothetical protein
VANLAEDTGSVNCGQDHYVAIRPSVSYSAVPGTGLDGHRGSGGSVDEAACSAASEQVCLLVCAGIQLTAFYEERPAVARCERTRCERTLEIAYVTECLRETGDEVWPFL